MTIRPELPQLPQGASRVVLFNTKGEKFERWAIDAREMLATGEYSLTPPGVEGGPSVVLPPRVAQTNPVPHVAAAEAALAMHPHNLMKQGAGSPSLIPEEKAPQSAQEASGDGTQDPSATPKAEAPPKGKKASGSSRVSQASREKGAKK